MSNQDIMHENNTDTHAVMKEAAESHMALIDKLDDFLAQYLELLDQYQKCREAFGSSMSGGFMSLAQANFTSSNRSRFGRDYYDERMKAIRKVEIEEGKEGDAAKFLVVAEAVPAKKPEPKEPVDEQAESAEGPIAEEEDETDKKASEKEPKSENVKEEARSESQYKDPIHWFGILVPQALRSSQVQFAGAVQIHISDLINVDTKMKALEIEIRRTRKHLAKSSPKLERDLKE